MKIPMLDLSRSHEPLNQELSAAFQHILSTNQYILGKPVEAFEQACADYLGVPFALGVSSGSDALLLALMTLDIGPGDEVICPTYTFFATAGAVSRLGARPVFVDIDPASYNWNLEQVFAARTEKTKAVIPVHLFGACANMQGLRDWGKEYNIAVIEDAAQAMGARWQGQQAGTVGDFGCYSFFPSKNLGGFGDGGLLVTSDSELAEKARILRTHGSKPKYYHHLVGGNFRLDALQAALMQVKLPHLESYLQAREQAASRYAQLFHEAGLLAQLSLPEAAPELRHTFNQYVIRLNTGISREALQKHLQAAGVATAVYYPLALHQQPCFAGLGYEQGSFPEAEAAAQQTLALPIFPGILAEEQAYIVNCLAKHILI